MLGSPVKDYEQLTRLGAGAYLFNEFRGIFRANGIRSYDVVESLVIALLQIARVLYKKILRSGESICMLKCSSRMEFMKLTYLG